MRSHDTHPAAYEVQLDVYRRMTPGRKVEIALELSESVRRTARSGIRKRHPEYSEQQVTRALVALIHGRETAQRVWPNEPPVVP
ncbi:hypothetical protein LZC95_38995 [Pendulispora brunnea]|uniref:Uncharacterized protein n=1 Tax=Pendulispora brunnea TaxID=2905690 RepID=A0ABZ2K116_9BACT